MTGKDKILVIDDERDLLDILKDGLTHMGYEVATCDKGKDGIKEAGNNKYNLILIDVRMPEMDGIEVIRSIGKIDNKAKFLIMTAYSITGEVTDLLESSRRVWGYIFKPFEMERLQEKIEQILKSP